MEKQLGNLIILLSEAPQPTDMNYIDDIGNYFIKIIKTKVLLESLCEQVIKAEKTVSDFPTHFLSKTI